jgi:TDG/mug DNA glycosylase family protein
MYPVTAGGCDLRGRAATAPGGRKSPADGKSPQPRRCRLPVMARHVEPGGSRREGPPSPRPARPSREELQAAYGRTVPDLIAHGLRVVLVGINPSLWSGAVGYHFASPSNRLWPTLQGAGFTGRRLHPSETDEVVRCGLGVTNLVDRATARADELSKAEILAGAERVTSVAERWQPTYLAYLGLSTFRVAFRRPKASVGPQPDVLGGSRVWLLPNPSGLNASYQLPDLIAAYSELRAAAYP